MSEKRKDTRGRILRNGESQRSQDGRYLFHYTGTDGKRKTIYGKTLSELREKEKKVLRDVSDGIDGQQADRLTLNQLFDQYLQIRSADARPSTVTNYSIMWNSRVRDGLGRMKISSIKPSHIEALYAEMTTQGLAKNTIKLISALLKATLEMAVKNDIIRKNPAVGIKCSGAVKKREALTADQQERLLNFVKINCVFKDKYPFLVTALGTGLRVGELTGLVWENVDLKNNLLHVDHQLQYRKCSDDEGTTFRITKLKTDAGKRDIPLSPAVRMALTEQRKLSLARGTLNTATVDGTTGFIFTSRNGQPLATNSVNSFLKNVIEQYNKMEPSEPLPHVSAHVLRHTACTRLVESGIDLKIVQAIMGHSSVSLTLGVYTHAGDAERAQEQISKMEMAGGYM